MSQKYFLQRFGEYNIFAHGKHVVWPKPNIKKDQNLLILHIIFYIYYFAY